MTLTGRVRKQSYLEAELYDLATTNPRGRGEALVVPIEIRPDPQGVIVTVGRRRLLVPDAVLDAIGSLEGPSE